MPVKKGQRPRKRAGGMTAAHKAALAAGRDDGRAVKAYLEALAATPPKRRGRPRTKESIQKRLSVIEAELAKAAPLGRLHLVQERRNLTTELAAVTGQSKVDLAPLRKKFVAVAKRYGERKGIGYDAWREVGVDPETLRAAGIAR